MQWLLLVVCLAVKTNNSFMFDDGFFVEFGDWTLDCPKMIPAIFAAYQHHAHGKAAGRLHIGWNVVEGEADPAVAGTVWSGSVRTKPVMKRKLTNR